LFFEGWGKERKSLDAEFAKFKRKAR